MRGGMVSATFAVSAAELALSADQWGAPVAIIDLAREPGDVRNLALPPCPVVGLGSQDHPLASRLDLVIDERGEGPGLDLDGIVAAAARHPHSAAVVAQLLRLLPELPPALGLDAESLAYATLQGSAEHRAWKAAQLDRQMPPAGRIELTRSGNELVVTLDRAEAGNAIDRAMRDGLNEALALANVDHTIARVLLRANGKAFSLGAELAEFGTTNDPATAHMIRRRTLPAREALRCADRLESTIDGACVGAGLELAAFSIRITATSRSWFQLPELAMGILPGAGGCVSLTRRIGRQRTLLMILSGRRIGARQALDWGLVDALVDQAP